MGRVTKVPITPKVLAWAIEESGFDQHDVATAASVGPDVLKAWLDGYDRPTLTQTRALSVKLRRPLAAFLLPHAPKTQQPFVQFRAAPGVSRRSLNAAERNALRDAGRIQRVVAWAQSERGELPIRMPHYQVATNVESAAGAVRRLLANSEAE